MSQCLPPPPLRPVASGFSAHSPFICVGDYVKSKVGPDTVPDADPLPSVRLVSPRQREVDISSEANFLASFHQSAGGCDPRAATPGPPCAIMGTVTSVAYGRGTATVAVWKRGEDFLVDRRPAIVYPLRALKRITAKEFARDCGRPYLRHKERSMAASAAGGDDEATPASLAVHYASVLIAAGGSLERCPRTPTSPSATNSAVQWLLTSACADLPRADHRRMPADPQRTIASIRCPQSSTAPHPDFHERRFWLTPHCRRSGRRPLTANR
jgi:hypothetical protein